MPPKRDERDASPSCDFPPISATRTDPRARIPSCRSSPARGCHPCPRYAFLRLLARAEIACEPAMFVPRTEVGGYRPGRDLEVKDSRERGFPSFESLEHPLSRMMTRKGLDVPFSASRPPRPPFVHLPAKGCAFPKTWVFWYRFVSPHRRARSLSFFDRPASSHATFV